MVRRYCYDRVYIIKSLHLGPTSAN